MQKIAKSIEEFIRTHYKKDKTVEVCPFNNCVLLTYFNGMKINDHRDIKYSADGKYQTLKNSQKEKTVTAILVIGEPCDLKFTLYSHRSSSSEEMTQYEKSFFKHSSDGVGKNGEGTMSLGIAMRVACHSREVNRDTGQLIVKDTITKSHQKSEDMLQEYLENETQKQANDEERMKIRVNCSNKYFQ
jgi:hypothetical protein